MLGRLASTVYLIVLHVMSRFLVEASARVRVWKARTWH